MEVEKWRWFGPSIVFQRQLEGLPIVFVPIFVIWFFTVVFGASLFYEGKSDLGIGLLVAAAVASVFILIAWWRIIRIPKP